MLKNLAKLIDIEKMTAVVTCFIVSASALYLMWSNAGYSASDLILTAILFIIFVVAWLAGIRDEPYQNEVRVRLSLMTLQYVAILAIFFQVPFSYTAILVTIWSAQMPYYMSIKTAIFLSPLWSAPTWLVYAYYWERDFVHLTGILYWTFNLFALVMVNAMLREQKAREAAHELNRELMATQALLSEASKQAERVRIARNIHDLLGHHLTALTINLQVAARVSQDQARDKIEECHSLAKLLLSDVREAVSEIREKSNLQLEEALRALVANVPHMQVQLDYDASLKISNVTVADTLLRCVQESLTNSLKHSNADQFTISLQSRNNAVELNMRDNGQQKNDVTPGNGLKGIKERITELGGKVRFLPEPTGFVTQIELPEPV